MFSNQFSDFGLINYVLFEFKLIHLTVYNTVYTLYIPVYTLFNVLVFQKMGHRDITVFEV